MSNYTETLTRLRALRDERLPLAKELTRLQAQVAKLDEQITDQLVHAAAFPQAKPATLAPAAGLGIAEVVERAPALAPQPAPHQNENRDPAPPTGPHPHPHEAPRSTPERSEEAAAGQKDPSTEAEMPPTSQPSAVPATATTSPSPAAPPVASTATPPAPALASTTAAPTEPAAPVAPAAAPAGAAPPESAGEVSSPEQTAPPHPNRKLREIPTDAGEDWFAPLDKGASRAPNFPGQRPRPMAWLDITTGELVHRGGSRHLNVGDQTAATLLTVLHTELPLEVERVYITAGAPWHRNSDQHATLIDAVSAWLYAPLPEGWRVARGGNTSDRDRLAGHLVHERNPVGRWQLGENADARYLEVRSIGEWFDPDGASPGVCRAAFGLLWNALREQWKPWKPRTPDESPGEQVVLMGSPGQTGLELWERTLGKKTYPLQSEEVRHLLHATSGQGRFELLTPPRVPEQLPQMWELDRTVAYGHHTSKGAVGTPQRHTPRTWGQLTDTQQRSMFYKPSWWQFRATVPAGWTQVGILPSPSADGRSWQYPATPGHTFTGWASGHELGLAWQHGWTIEILDALVWQEGEPLKEFGTRCRTVWESLTARAALAADAHERAAAYLASRAVRSILLYGIGRLASRGRDTTGKAATTDHVPRHAEIIGGDPPGPFTWVRRNAQTSHMHPEWPIVNVWAGNRAALLSAADPKAEGTRVGALHLPEGINVIGMRNDSLLLSGNPNWPYRHEVGRWRIKGHLPGPVATPTSEADLLALRDLARAHYTEEQQQETP